MADSKLTQNTPDKNSLGITILSALFWAILAAAGAMLFVYVMTILLAFVSLVYEWHPIIVSSAFGAIIPVGITSALIISFRYLAIRINDRSRVIQVYKLIGLLIIVTFLISKYKMYQEKLFVKDIYTQFYEAIQQQDYATAYKLMSPSYQNTRTLAVFRNAFWLKDLELVNSIHAVGFNSNRSEASIVPNSDISLSYYPVVGCGLDLVKLHGEWYFTGGITCFEGGI